MKHYTAVKNTVYIAFTTWKMSSVVKLKGEEVHSRNESCLSHYLKTSKENLQAKGCHGRDKDGNSGW